MLTRHKLFCMEYVKDFNGARAYRAVYEKGGKKLRTPGDSASKILQRDDVKEFISDIVQKAIVEKVAESKEVMEYFTSVMRGDIVMSDRERNKAAEILAKRYGLLSYSSDGSTPPIIVDDV